MTRFCAAVTVLSCDVAAPRAACLPPRACTYAVWVDEVESLSRKADLPCAGRPAGRVPLLPCTERGAAFVEAAFRECDDVWTPVARVECRGAAPALLTEIIAVVSATAAVAATNDRRAVPLPGRLMSVLHGRAPDHSERTAVPPVARRPSPRWSTCSPAERNAEAGCCIPPERRVAEDFTEAIGA
jgi:hypothetical protein